MARLTSVFNEVKRNFYPRWDKAHEWKVRRKSRLSDGYNTSGMCNLSTKTIEISRSYVPEDDNELRWLLAHEICHAVAPGNHGLIWQRRFLRVSDRAAFLGQQALADRIRKDIEIVKVARKPSLVAIQHSIEDALMDQPDASFEVVIEWVANNWDFTSYGLLKKYKSLRGFFDRMKRWALWARKHEEEFRQRLGKST